MKGHHVKSVKKIGLVSRVYIPTIDNVLLYRSVMPYGTYDIKNKAYEIWREIDFDIIINLTSKKESTRKAKKNIKELYENIYSNINRKEIINIPINSLMMYDMKNKFPFQYICKIAKHILFLEEQKKNIKICVHCSGGIGRTGLFYGMLLIQQKKLSLSHIKIIIEENMPNSINILREKVLNKYKALCDL